MNDPEREMKNLINDRILQGKEALQKEYDRGWLLGRETALEELRYIYSTHFRGCEHPHTGTVSMIIDLLEERLDLK